MRFSSKVSNDAITLTRNLPPIEDTSHIKKLDPLLTIHPEIKRKIIKLKNSQLKRISYEDKDFRRRTFNHEKNLNMYNTFNSGQHSP